MKRPGLFVRLARDQRGVSAVEFALLAPILIFFYFGLAEFCQGYMAHKRMSHVSAAVADLVSQEDLVSASNVDDIFHIGGMVMKPFSTSTLKQRVSSVTLTAGVAKVDWSRASGMTGLAKGSTVALPADLIVNGQSIIMAEASYDYLSPIAYLIKPVTHFSAVYYLRPRTTDQTVCSNC